MQQYNDNKNCRCYISNYQIRILSQALYAPEGMKYSQKIETVLLFATLCYIYIIFIVNSARSLDNQLKHAKTVWRLSKLSLVAGSICEVFYID